MLMAVGQRVKTGLWFPYIYRELENQNSKNQEEARYV